MTNYLSQPEKKMKLTCPGCGSIASAETWVNDALCRETMLAITTLPNPLHQSILGYISLFRPGTRALTWKKAKRLVSEIAALTATGHIQIKGKVSRPCPPRIWAMAMEQMQERRDSLNLPMPNHNYLRKIAWEIADREDAGAEKVHREQEGRCQSPKLVSSDPLQKARDKWDKKNAGKIQGEFLPPNIKGIE